MIHLAVAAKFMSAKCLRRIKTPQMARFEHYKGKFRMKYFHLDVYKKSMIMLQENSTCSSDEYDIWTVKIGKTTGMFAQIS